MASKETVKVKELRERSTAELESLLATKVEELHGNKFKHALGQLSTTHRLRQLKRDIARLKSTIGERSRPVPGTDAAAQSG